MYFLRGHICTEGYRRKSNHAWRIADPYDVGLQDWYTGHTEEPTRVFVTLQL